MDMVEAGLALTPATDRQQPQPFQLRHGSAQRLFAHAHLCRENALGRKLSRAFHDIGEQDNIELLGFNGNIRMAHELARHLHKVAGIKFGVICQRDFGQRGFGHHFSVSASIRKSCTMSRPVAWLPMTIQFSRGKSPGLPNISR